MGVFRAVSYQFLLDRFGYPSVTGDRARPVASAVVNRLEGFSWQLEVDSIQRANASSFRIAVHGATLAPLWRFVECFYFVPIQSQVNTPRTGGSMTAQHIYRQPILREIDIDQLAEIIDEEADAGEDIGLESVFS